MFFRVCIHVTSKEDDRKRFAFSFIFSTRFFFSKKERGQAEETRMHAQHIASQSDDPPIPSLPFVFSQHTYDATSIMACYWQHSTTTRPQPVRADMSLQRSPRILRRQLGVVIRGVRFFFDEFARGAEDAC